MSRIKCCVPGVIVMLVLISCDGVFSPDPPLSTAKAIIGFGFKTKDNPGLADDVIAIIDGTEILFQVPFNTDLSRLVPTIIHTGTLVDPGDGEEVAFSVHQNTGYTVFAKDTSTRAYSVRTQEFLPLLAVSTSLSFIQGWCLGPSRRPG